MARALRDLVLVVAASVALGGCDRPEGPPAHGGPSSSASTSAATRAVIRVDVGHDAMSVKDATPYVIAPSAEIEIEIGEHGFRTRDAGPALPDVVHVVHGSSGYHRASFSGKRVVLNAGSLDAVKGGAFHGFEAGESYYVALGTEAPSASDGAMRFTPLWSARVNVASR